MADAAYSGKMRPHLAAIWEQTYPLVFGIVAAGAWIFYGSKLISFSNQNHWHLDQLYTAIFAFLAVTTGFLATFYCTIQCMTDGFIQRIRNTRTLSRYLAFTKQAIIIGFVISLASIPMMVITPLPIEKFSAEAFIVAIWFGSSVYAIASFYRVASLFFFLFETRIEGGRPAR